MTTEQVLFFLVHLGIFLFAISFHEAAHAITAKWGGDDTAESLGRITLNPLPHIDPIGTLVMPAVSAFTGVPLLGWAKPVPVVEGNLCRPEWPVIVALAGPFSNVLLAVAAMLASRLLDVAGASGALAPWLERGGLTYLVIAKRLIEYFALLNLLLAAFNMMPVPPLDGHWVLWHCYVKRRPRLHGLWEAYRTYGPFALMALVLFGLLGFWLSLAHWVLILPLRLVTSIGT